jgi:broad specificity phosphatase PhoE
MRPVLYCIRHGETSWNSEQRFQGRVEVDLNPNGVGQARRNGQRLAGLLAGSAEGFRFVSSPQLRARRSMEIIRAELGLDPSAYEADARLVEVAYGDWQGLTEAEIRRDYPELHALRARDKWNFVPPGAEAESYAMQARRVAAWLAEAVRPTVVVSHGGVMRCLLVLAAGWDPDRAGQFEVPQDRILRVEDGRIEWL